MLGNPGGMLTSVATLALYVLTRSLDREFYGYTALTDWSFVANALTYGFLLSVPLVALGLKILYWREPLAAHLIHTFHLGAAALVSAATFLLLDSAVKLLWRTEARAPFDPAWLAIIVPVAMAGYLYQSLRLVYGGSRPRTVAGVLAVLLLLGVSVILVAMGAASMAARRG